MNLRIDEMHIQTAQTTNNDNEDESRMTSTNFENEKYKLKLDEK